MIENGYVLIDSGTDGLIYGHAQNNYLPKKFGKTMYDEKMRPNYKLVENTPTKLSDEEKTVLFPPVEPEPSEIDKLKMRQEVTEQALQDLILITMGGE